MIDEFISVESEEEPPRLLITCANQSLRFFLYIESTNELSLVGDLSQSIPYGSICVDQKVIYECPSRSGAYIYHPLLKEQQNWNHWGWLLTSQTTHRDVIGLERLLSKEGFTIFHIKLIGTPPKPLGFLPKEDCTKDDNIPYRADRLLPDNSPRSLSEHIYLSRIIDGQQPLGQPEAQLLWKHRLYLAKERPQALSAFLRSLDWRDDQEVALALILVVEEWQPLLSLLQIIETLDTVLHIVPKDFAFQVDQAMSTFLFKNPSIWHYSCLLEKLAVETLLKISTDYPQIKTYLQRSVLIEHAVKSFPWADELVKIADQVRHREATRQARTSQLRTALASVPLGTGSPLPFYTSNVRIVGIAAERSIVFKSNAMPVRVSLVRESDCGEVLVLVKSGEDIRNDQWLMAIFEYARTLWRQYRLPFLAECMITYGVFPYDNAEDDVMGGVIEYIPSQSLTNELEEGEIQASEQFIWSCAGYTLLTWLFGVGDRHLDNLLITSAGCLFHVDYAYLFGADPKPFAPPMKLCPEMVQALPIARFQKIMLAALRILQNHTSLIQAVVELGFGAEQGEFVRERLCTGDDRLKELVEESARAMMPQVMETIHKWSQYWKA